MRWVLTVSSGDSVGRGATDAELLCCLSRRETGLDQFAGCRDGVGVERRATGFTTALSGCGDTVTSAFRDEATLEVSDGTEDMKNEFAGG